MTIRTDPRWALWPPVRATQYTAKRQQGYGKSGVRAETVEADDLVVGTTQADNNRPATTVPGEGYGDRIRGLVSG